MGGKKKKSKRVNIKPMLNNFYYFSFIFTVSSRTIGTLQMNGRKPATPIPKKLACCIKDQ